MSKLNPPELTDADLSYLGDADEEFWAEWEYLKTVDDLEDTYRHWDVPYPLYSEIYG
jgi:hypothetical protein